jgi:cytochrome c-type biogenesis protein
MNESVGILAALTAGLISFVSPCVLPVVPAYLSFVTGLSIEEMRGSSAGGLQRRRLLLNCLAFVGGFSAVFVALGASASFVGAFLNQNMQILAKVAGVVIVLFGLHTLGILKIPFLNYEKRFHQTQKSGGLLGSFIVGLAFAFGWTPCIGPILGAILGIASTKETIGQGVVLLSAYSLGLGVPFLVAGLSVESFFRVSSRVKSQFRLIEKLSGAFLIIVGVLIFFNMFGWLSAQLSRLFPGLADLG